MRRNLPSSTETSPPVSPVTDTPADERIVVEHLHSRDYATTRENLLDAIIGEGLVVGPVSQFGDMLMRTAAAVGQGEPIYRHAEIIFFCSARIAWQLAREAPENLSLCPLSMALYQLHGADERCHLSYRLPAGMSTGHEQARALLQRIAARVSALD